MSDVEKIVGIDWLERWAGSYTFLSCSYWGEQYFVSLRREFGVQFDHTLFIHTKGTVSFFILREEYERFGKTLAEEVTRDPALAQERLKILKQNSDLVTSVMVKLDGGIPTWNEYQEFLLLFNKQLPYHNFMKKTVDFLPAEVSSLLGFFKEARVYSEHVYSDTEKFFRNVMQAVATKENRNADTLTCLDKAEFETYLKTNDLPAEGVLQSRFEKSILYFENGEQNLLLGDEVGVVESGIFKNLNDVSELQGVGAFPGKITGVARVVLDPHNPGEFEDGDILITGMTRPEFLPLIQKAGGIITDVGGVLCHAAITARELKIPCLVGTRLATKVFRSGDTLALDTESGIVKKN